jgi:hypothetical protein
LGSTVRNRGRRLGRRRPNLCAARQVTACSHREKRLVGAILVVAPLPADAACKTGATTRVAPTAGDVGGPSIVQIS